ncbi:helix-turn-helix domain-containing protein [Mesorhizobium sp. 113-1-2]|uniref:helix-turn-helix domain-containing protein n=1 Tax=Mesorhizobium sp. 113-1-2 TaxID=2744515 RepID=UPI001926F1C5|nr:helix-turn-helix domain-containing protein [Mesorhizobium sp. 113-1-2]
MAKPERKRLPWEKYLVDLTKFDWLTAVCLSHDHKHAALQLRLAIVLMQHADPETMVAWPTQETLAKYAGVADERQARRAIKALCDSHAILRCRISELDEASQEKVTRNKRGVAYTLSLPWAFAVLEASKDPLPAEPKHLRDARRNRTTAVLSNRTTAVRYEQDYGSPPYTKRKRSDQIKEAPDRKDLASTPARESTPSNSYSSASRGG